MPRSSASPPRVTGVAINAGRLDLSWRDFRPGASYRVENSSDGTTSASVPRPDDDPFLLRVVGNGG